MTVLANEPMEESIVLVPALQQEIDIWLKKYPTDQRQSAIIPALLIAQRYYEGWLPRPIIDRIADYIGMARIAAYEVATFYSMLELKPVGKHKLSICTNVSCMLNGSEKIVQHVKNRLNVNFGETTLDQKFTLKEVECLGACTRAPVVLMDETYHENVTTDTVDALIEELG